MKLSEIATDPSTVIYSLELDEIPKKIPSTLKSVFIKAKMENGIFSSSFITNLSYWVIKSKPYNITTTVEFEDLNEDQITQIILVCGNLQVSISLLPPSNPSKEDEKKYTQLVIAATRSVFKLKANAPYIYPITNYVEYLASNALTGAERSEPNDLYTLTNFKSAMDEEFVTDLKASLASVIYEINGGKETFSQSIKAYAYLIADSIENSLDYQLEESK